MQSVARGQNEAGSPAGEETEEKTEEDAVATNRDYARHADGRFAPTGAGVHSHKGVRAGRGNPKGSPNKTNTPRRLPANATQGQAEKELARAIKLKRSKGGKVQTVAGVAVTVSATQHQQKGHRNDPLATPGKMAKALTRKPYKDADGVVGRYKGLKTVADPHGKGTRIAVTAFTEKDLKSHKKKDPDQGSGPVQDR